MKNLLYTFILSLAFVGCQNTGQTGGDGAAESQEANAAASGQTACYIRAEGPDTTFVNLTIAADGAVTGTYDWLPWEKDGARGTVTGQQDGEIIRLMYDYTIEGSNQQQEMLMKLTGDQLAEAEGELVEGDGGVLKLKDPSNVTYKPLTKVACK